MTGCPHITRGPGAGSARWQDAEGIPSRNPGGFIPPASAPCPKTRRSAGSLLEPCLLRAAACRLCHREIPAGKGPWGRKEARVLCQGLGTPPGCPQPPRKDCQDKGIPCETAAGCGEMETPAKFAKSLV